MTTTLKYFLIILIASVLFAVVVYFLLSPKSEVETKGAFLFLEPSSQNMKVEDEFTVNVMLDSGKNQVVAVSAFLVFDPSLLELTSIDSSSSAFNKRIKEEANNGIIEISRINFAPDSTDLQSVSGSNLLLTKLNFKAKSAGKAVVSFSTSDNQQSAVLRFDKDNPSLSEDILTETKEGNYIIE